MTMNGGRSAPQRPADVCKALLAALEAAEGRRRSRKRNQTPDAYGLAVKRELLRRVIEADPEPQQFESWLLAYPQTCGAPELAGPALAMARGVYEDWRLAHTSEEFRRWLAAGAPSADRAPEGDAATSRRRTSRSEY